MIKFSEEKVLLLHKLITEETGGDPNVRDLDLLDSALESAFATFGGEELYPSIEEKGARLGFSLIANHAFVDGNTFYNLFYNFFSTSISTISHNTYNILW